MRFLKEVSFVKEGTFQKDLLLSFKRCFLGFLRPDTMAAPTLTNGPFSALLYLRSTDTAKEPFPLLGSNPYRNVSMGNRLIDATLGITWK